MKKLLRLLLWLTLGLFAAIGIATVVYFTRFNGGEVLLRGALETKVHAAFFRTDNVTRVRIYRLGEMSETETDTSNAFPIIPYDGFAKIESRIELSDTEIKDFTELWRGMSPNYRYQALCHMPAFAVEFFAGDERTFRTSICWRCNNFYVEYLPGAATWYGFDADAPKAQRMLKYFEDKLPRK